MGSRDWSRWASRPGQLPAPPGGKRPLTVCPRRPVAPGSWRHDCSTPLIRQANNASLGERILATPPRPVAAAPDTDRPSCVACAGGPARRDARDRRTRVTHRGERSWSSSERSPIAVAGRRESPVDPAAGPVQRFASELRDLRQKADGLTYRAMAKRAGYSVTTLSQAAAGERLPSLPVVLAFVQACEGDVSEWERRWQQVADELARQRADEDDAAGPYLGLASYDTHDSDRFFGRERLVEELHELLRRHRFAAVFGPSGSGKSSLLRAGLVPAARGETTPSGQSFGQSLILTPGEHPMRHADRFVPGEGGFDTLIVVDQFEEVFTLCRDQRERGQFIDLLLSARQPQSGMKVVIAVRADFYGRCAEHRELTVALREANLLVGPMQHEELREAIVRPAMAEGLTVERALTAAIVADVADEPGALPLMSHALREVWRRRTGKMLTLGAYESVGRVHGAISHTAEELYAGLSPAQARIARRVLLRLISPGEQAQDTRRPAARAELDPYGEADTALVIEQLASARLLTLHQDSVELAHEALIESWPRLRGWVDEGRDRLRTHRQLTEAAQGWEAHGRDAGLLYRGARLAVVDKLFVEPGDRDDLTPLERTFVDASAALARRNSRRRVAVSAVLVVLLVASMVAAGVAVRQAGLADDRLAEATARLVARRAATLRMSDPKLARRLSAAAWRIAPVPEARSELIDSMALPLVDVVTAPYNATDLVHGLSVDGARLAVYTPGTAAEPAALRIFDLVTKKEIAHTRWSGQQVWKVVWSPDGRTVAVDDDTDTRLWAVDGARLTDLGVAFPQLAPTEFSPDGRFLIGVRDELNEVWSVADGTRVLLEPVSAISPDGRLALVIPVNADELTATLSSSGDGRSSGRRVELWDFEQRKPLRASWLPHTATDGVFSPDGKHLAVSTSDGIWLFDLSSGKAVLRPLLPASGRVEFSPDGRFLVGTQAEGRVTLWRVDDGTLLMSSPIPSDVVAADARFSPDTRLLRVTGQYGTVNVLDISPYTHPEVLAPGGDERLFSPDGRYLVTTNHRKGRPEVRLWDVAARRPVSGPLPVDDLPEEDSTETAYAPVFSPDGRTLALAHPASPVVTLWDVTNGRRVGAFRVRSRGAVGVMSLTFSPDGRSVAFVPLSPYPDDKEAMWDLELWDVRARRWLRTVAGAGSGIMIFEPDGRRLFVDVSPEGRILVDTATGEIHRRSSDARAEGEILFIENMAAIGDVDGRVTFWDRELRRPLSPPQTAHTASINALVPYPRGELLATVAGEGEYGIQLWDWRGHQRIASPITYHTRSVPAVAFNRTALLVSSADGALREITVDPGAATAVICRRDGGLSPAEWQAHIPELAHQQTCHR
ncbi:nSTAND1 domain-containing NTPase [Nonomuraea dietziae]|uniref:nSTAND1 domain-containing NTPase n=1 Tax=Nonomuraea dietziae TaxID=65515 RepID=UPI0033C20C65